MTFPAQMNQDLLYRDPDGREGFIVFNRTAGLAYIGVDIAAQQQGNHLPIGLTADALRQLADHLENGTPLQP